MLKSSKNVFWEALLITIVVFVLGLLIGIAFEEKKVDAINEYYAQSEISMMDLFALNSLINLEDVSCEVLVDSNLQFADRIYEEAMLLEKYEEAGKVDDSMRLAHKKYDILRTFLWMNMIKTKEKCGGVSSVVYLYNSETEDLTEKAENNVWSKILADLKYEKGDEIVLIPIAVDSNLVSLNTMLSDYDLSKFPVVIIDEQDIVTELSSVDDLNEYF